MFMHYIEETGPEQKHNCSLSLCLAHPLRHHRRPLEHKLELNFLLRMVLPLRAISFVMLFFAQASSQRTKGQTIVLTSVH